MWHPCLIPRASLHGKKFQGSLPKPAETIRALKSPFTIPQLAGWKLTGICLCALVCLQWRRSLTLGVSDLLLLTLLSILLFFLFWAVAFTTHFMLNSRKYHLQISPQVSYIASPSLPHLKDPEPEWLEGKLYQWQKHPEFWGCLKTLHREHDVSWGYLPKFKTTHVPVQIPPTPYFLHLC